MVVAMRPKSEVSQVMIFGLLLDLDMQKHNHIPVVFFSGGLDSTYVLYDLLRKGTTVDIVSYELSVEGAMNAAQAVARANILRELTSLVTSGELPGKINRNLVYRIQGGSHRVGITGLLSVSTVFSIATQVMCNYNDRIIIGFVKDDRTPGTINEAQKAWELLQQVSMTIEIGSENGLPYLSYEYGDVSKEDILKELPSSISEYVTWCTDPQRSPDCGACYNCNKTGILLKKLIEEKQHPFEEGSTSYLFSRVESMERLKELNAPVPFVPPPVIEGLPYVNPDEI